MNVYSHDLRIRIFSYSLTHSIRETAQVFQVSPNTVYLLKKRFSETGQLEPRQPATFRPCAVCPDGEAWLRLVLQKEPDLTLQELCDRYWQSYGIRVCVSTMFNTLQRMRITRKRKTFHDPAKKTTKAKADKQAYDAKLAAIEVDKRFYLDETGSRLNMTLSYGRAPQGERAHDDKPVSPGVGVSTAALLSKDGVKAEYTYTGNLTAPLFMAYLESFVVPLVTDGQVLIMDRHPVHTAKSVPNFLRQHHIKFLYLPAHSPELNPIEEMFSKIKHYLKRQKARIVPVLLDAIKNAFASINQDDINGYFSHAAEF